VAIRSNVICDAQREDDRTATHAAKPLCFSCGSVSVGMLGLRATGGKSRQTINQYAPAIDVNDGPVFCERAV